MKTLRTTFLAICLSLVTASAGYSQNHYQPIPHHILSASEYSCIGEYMRHTRKGSGTSSLEA